MKKTLFIILMLALSHTKLFAATKTAIITGSFAGIENGESATLLVNEYGYIYSQPLCDFRKYISVIKNHKFYFKIPVNSTPLYAELHFTGISKKESLVGFIIERDDNIRISENSNGYLFNGRGSKKYSVWEKLNNLSNRYYKETAPYRANNTGMREMYIKNDSIGSIQLKYLESQKDQIDKTAYISFKASVYSFIFGTVPLIFYHYTALKDTLSSLALSSIVNYKRALPLELMPTQRFDKEDLLKFSGGYASALILQFQLDSCYLLKKPFLVSKCYSFMVKKYSGALRERIIINLLYRYRDNGQDISSTVIDSHKYISNESFLTIIHKLETSKIEDALAYNFTLADKYGNLHQLNEYRGKVVLLDFWYTGCGNCIRVAPYLKKIEQKFVGKQVAFLSINIDQQKKHWLESLKSDKYSSDLSINLNTGSLGQKHPVCQYFEINAFPTLILIDKNGRLMKSPIDPRNDDGEHLARLIEEKL